MKVQQGKHGRQRPVEWEVMPSHGWPIPKIIEGGSIYNIIFDNREEAADFAYRILAALPAMYLPERPELVTLAKMIVKGAELIKPQCLDAAGKEARP